MCTDMCRVEYQHGLGHPVLAAPLESRLKVVDGGLCALRSHTPAETTPAHFQRNTHPLQASFQVFYRNPEDDLIFASQLKEQALRAELAWSKPQS